MGYDSQFNEWLQQQQDASWHTGRRVGHEEVVGAVDELLDEMESNMAVWGTCSHEWVSLDKIRGVLKIYKDIPDE